MAKSSESSTIGRQKLRVAARVAWPAGTSGGAGGLVVDGAGEFSCECGGCRGERVANGRQRGGRLGERCKHRRELPGSSNRAGHGVEVARSTAAKGEAGERAGEIGHGLEAAA